jgi:hypothetical protein
VEIPVPRSATQRAAETAAAAQEAAARAPVGETPPWPDESNEPPYRVPPPALGQITARWSEVGDAIKRNKRGALAQYVQLMVPQEINANGALRLGYQPADDMAARAVEQSRGDVLLALQGTFEGINSFTLRVIGQPLTNTPGNAASKRLTAEDVQQQRTDQLTSRNALLDAAVRKLDLELLD